MDTGGFRHHYAHLQTTHLVGGEHILPGWVIGTSGHTGHVEPCGTAGAHLHYRITDPDNNPCTLGRCVPEPLSDDCGYAGISCTDSGAPFSHDPSWGGAGEDRDPWKDVSHLSNNYGVGDREVTEHEPIQSRWDIQERYRKESVTWAFTQGLSERIVGKPGSPYTTQVLG